MRHKVLIVEDEPELVGILSFLIKDEGHDIEIAFDGKEALKIIKSNPPDLVLLDIMLPNINGFELCNIIRRNSTIPVIILSAKVEDENIIKGLELGADDYITKPFNHRELVLRINSLLKRTQQYKTADILESGDIKICYSSKEVFVKGQLKKLTPKEFNLLYFMAKNENHVLSWRSLLQEVWGTEEWEGGNELIKVTISRLRQKLEPDPSNPVYLLNVWGMGYKFVIPE